MVGLVVAFSCPCERHHADASTHVHQSLCSSYSTSRGPGQKIVSVALYGLETEKSKARYAELIPNITADVKYKYPGYVMRLYSTINVLDRIHDAVCHAYCCNEHLDICDVDELPQRDGFVFDSRIQPNGMIWRFLPVRDPLVSIVLVRDTDNPIWQREVDAVDDWLATDKRLHGTRDHPEHWGVPLLGGCWGYRRLDDKYLRAETQLLLENKIARHGQDQFILAKFFRHLRHTTLIHDAYHCSSHEISGALVRPFPTQAVVDERGRRTTIGCRDPVKIRECPKACRPASHMDWSFC